MSDVDALRGAFLTVEPTYAALGERVARLLDAGRTSRGIKGAVSWRCKDVDSFIKKAIRKGYDDPMTDIRDKVGVRIVLVYKGDVESIREVIRGSFVVLHEEDKIEELGTTKLGYQGVHFEVALKPDDFVGEEALQDLVCEIQIHTRAQNAWAEVSHELVYKSVARPPVEIERRVMLLQAIVEMFDREVEEIRNELMDSSERRTVKMLAILEPHFLRLSGSDYDQELSMRVLEWVEPLYEDMATDELEQRIDDFVTSNRTKLASLFASYQEVGGGTNPLLLQPESLPLFERLEHDMFAVLDGWDDRLDFRLLERLAASWGIALPTTI